MKFQNLPFRIKILLSICVPLVLATAIGVISILNLRALNETDKWVDHTYNVIIDAEVLLKSAVDMETGERGYLLSGKEEFLEPYTSGAQRIYEQFITLKLEVSDNPKQVMRLDNAETIIREWQKNVAGHLIALRHEIKKLEKADMSLYTEKQKEIASIVGQAKGKEYFDRFREVMEAFTSEEQGLLMIRQGKDSNKIKTIERLIVGCIIIAILVGLFFAFFVTRGVQKLVGGEPAKIAEIAQNVARGNLDVSIDEKEPVGILGALVEMISVLNGIVSEVNNVAFEVEEGKLDTRGDESTYQGGWKNMVLGVNNVIETITGHIDQIPNPFMLIDKEFNILYMNKIGNEWTGRSKEQAVGQKCYDLFRTPDGGTTNCVFARAMNSGNLESGMTDAHPGNMHLKVDYNGVPLKNKSGECVGALEIFVDQTSQRDEDWLKSGLNELNNKMSNEQNPIALSQNALNFLADYLHAQVGACYLTDKKDDFRLASSYAYKMRSNNYTVFKLGESMIGQAALEKKTILFSDVPKEHIPFDINSGVGDSTPNNIIVFPVIHEQKVLGVMVLGTASQFNNKEMEFVERAAGSISINLSSAQAQVQTQSLLEQTQTQQEELRVSNEELEQQAEELKSSEEQLQVQQEELRVTNEELTEKSELLSKQKDDVEKSNAEIRSSREELKNKARDLELSTKYKSEFLANMSHELRTPLNSMLLLSNKLAKNSDENLTEKQVKDAEIVYKSGKDLLELINDILDLSKVESGNMNINVEDVAIADIVSNMQNIFSTIMEEKGLTFNLNVDKQLPPSLCTDQQRVEQVLKNLISNALKFTQTGTIGIEFFRPDSSVVLSSNSSPIENMVGISVSDTGTGIPKEKQREIFEAFRQADGTIVRKYGGTGLGLSICKEMARVLEGEIQLQSTVDEGSVFTLFLPEKCIDKLAMNTELVTEAIGNRIESPSEVKGFISGIKDDRLELSSTDKAILIIEDDVRFAQIVYDICKEKGMKCIHTTSGEEGLQLVQEYQVSAMLLDIKLPGIDGWEVLKRLKYSSHAKHIPVHIMSVNDKPGDYFNKGVIGYLQKPASSEALEKALSQLSNVATDTPKKLLVCEDQSEVAEQLIETFSGLDVEIDIAKNGMEGLQKIQANSYDSIILDLMLPDITGLELLKKLDTIEGFHLPPVIIHTAKSLTAQESFELSKYASSMITKEGESQDRLVDEVSLFLHAINSTSESHGTVPYVIVDDKKVFEGKKIMIVDDDARNIYSVISVLEEYKMNFVKAQNGKMALKELENHPDIDVVLMDIMMPEMDGYEATRKIREMPNYKTLPIIALTAKGMKKDRQLCLEAGVTDYLMKPIDADKLLSTMRVCLHS
ncbi:MAG: response regulator [Fibrobacterales bacterium]